LTQAATRDFYSPWPKAKGWPGHDPDKTHGSGFAGKSGALAASKVDNQHLKTSNSKNLGFILSLCDSWFLFHSPKGGRVAVKV